MLLDLCQHNLAMFEIVWGTSMLVGHGTMADLPWRSAHMLAA